MTGNLSDLTGQTIAHYRLERRIGGGAMAFVYRATNLILDHTIALKVLMPGADIQTRERFRQEARTVSKLNHPHIVETFQVGQTSEDGIAYIAMQLVEGQSLSTLLERYQTLSVVDTASLLDPVTRALDYAHNLGVVHRDVKPSNILLGRVRPGTPGSVQLSMLESPVIPLLSDFGIARALDSPELTNAGRTIGTPAYMAPEQCAGSREIDGRADIYSLGTVLYRCLVGRPPFVGTTTQILHAHVYEPLTIPDEVVYNLPPVIVETLQSSLMKEIEQRYPTAKLMGDDLAMAAGRQVAAPVVATQDSAESGATRTMEALPTSEEAQAVLIDEKTTSQQVLVPGGKTSVFRPRTSATPRSLSAVGLITHQKIVHPIDSSSANQRSAFQSSRNWLSLVLGAILFLLLAVVVFALIRSILPDNENGVANAPPNEQPQTEQVGSVADVTPTDMNPADVRPTDTEQSSLLRTPISDTVSSTGTRTATVTEPLNPPAELPTETLTATRPISNNGDITITTEISITNTLTPTNTPREEPTQEPTDIAPSVDLQSTLDDAQFFVEQRDWKEAQRYLTLVRRGNVRFEPELVDSLFFQSYVGLATELVTEAVTVSDQGLSDLQEATEFLDKALEIRNVPQVADLLDTTIRFKDASREDRLRARQALRDTHADYAEALADDNDMCAAVEQMYTAIRVLYDADLADKQTSYLKQCPILQDEFTLVDVAELVGGRILYSSFADGQRQIFIVNVETDAESRALVARAAQPSLQPTGNIIAFRSYQPEGVNGFDLNDGSLKPSDRSIRFTYNSEDSVESPPSWAPDGNRLVFGSTVEGGRVARIYWANNDPSGTYRRIADGRDPRWHPFNDQIAFKGADFTGNNPGIYVMRSDGSFRSRITTNLTDSRPVWFPDGQYIIFMSNGRDDNWDIYRVEVDTEVVTRLTNDPGFDALPTVSPDGKLVAFVSNRDGRWRIWTVPFEGGAPQPLVSIIGDLSQWLEHSIQWVK